MSKELFFIHFLQISITLLTVALTYGIYCAKKGNLPLHKRINSAILIITFCAVTALLITLILGFDYQKVCSPRGLFIHRCFSTPLLFSLIFTTFYAWKNNPKIHKSWGKISYFFWWGTLISAWTVLLKN